MNLRLRLDFLFCGFPWIVVWPTSLDLLVDAKSKKNRRQNAFQRCFHILEILHFYVICSRHSFIYSTNLLGALTDDVIWNGVKQVSGPDKPLAFQSLTVKSSLSEDQITPNPAPHLWVKPESTKQCILSVCRKLATDTWSKHTPTHINRLLHTYTLLSLVFAPSLFSLSNPVIPTAQSVTCWLSLSSGAGEQEEFKLLNV